MMAEQQNKELVRRLFEEVWNGNNMETAKEIIHPDYRSVENITFASLRGLQVLAADLSFYRDMYTDLKFEVERMIIEEDIVVTFWLATGVAKYETFVNRAGRELNRELSAAGASSSQIVDGKIIENRLYWPRHPLFP